jgi:hypothetical protein
VSALVERQGQSRSLLVPVASLALAVVGYVHFDLYRHGYPAIPVIGALFAANAIGSAVVATLLLFIQGRLMRLAGLAVAERYLTEL